MFIVIAVAATALVALPASPAFMVAYAFVAVTSLWRSAGEVARAQDESGDTRQRLMDAGVTSLSIAFMCVVKLVEVL